MKTKTFWFTAFRYIVSADYEQWFELKAAEGCKFLLSAL